MERVFWIKRGRRFLLLHSYRDGRGKVVQRRLCACRDEAELRRQLAEPGWSGLRQDLMRQCPEIAPDWDELRTRGRELCLSAEAAADPPATRATAGAPTRAAAGAPTRAAAGAPTRAAAGAADRPPGATERVLAIRRAIGRLRSLLGQERDPEVLAKIEPDIARLAELLGSEPPAEEDYRQQLERKRSALPAGRRKFERYEVEARDYFQALESTTDLLERSEQVEEAVEVLREYADTCRHAEVTARLGANLERLDRYEEALELYRGLSGQVAVRHYAEGVHQLRAGREDLAARSFMRGLARERSIAAYLVVRRKAPGSLHPDTWKRARAFWGCFDELWSEREKEFLVQVHRDPRVGLALTELGPKRARVREVLSPWGRERLLQRVRDRMAVHA